MATVRRRNAGNRRVAVGFGPKCTGGETASGTRFRRLWFVFTRFLGSFGSFTFLSGWSRGRAAGDGHVFDEGLLEWGLRLEFFEQSGDEGEKAIRGFAFQDYSV